MKPYYERAGVTLYHGDFREVLPELADASIDLILTDPPYGKDYLSNFRVRDPSIAQVILGDHSLDEARDALHHAPRLLRPDRHLYYFASADETVGEAIRCLPNGLEFQRLLCWDKGNHGMGDLECNYGHAWEAVVFATKGRRPLNAPRPSSLLRPFGRGAGSMWVHPTQKPVELIRFLIEKSSAVGEVVLDPFVGSGTTLRAAMDCRRRAIGIEIREGYCEIAASRLAQDVLPL